MIRNKYAGRCSCGRQVPARQGWVVGRRIACPEHAAEYQGAADEEREAMRGPYEDREIYGFGDE